MFLSPEENEQETPPNSRKIKFFSKYLNFANSLVHVHTSPMGKRFQEFVINIVISMFYVLWRNYYFAYPSIPNIAKISVCYSIYFDSRKEYNQYWCREKHIKTVNVIMKRSTWTVNLRQSSSSACMLLNQHC